MKYTCDYCSGYVAKGIDPTPNEDYGMRIDFNGKVPRGNKEVLKVCPRCLINGLNELFSGGSHGNITIEIPNTKIGTDDKES